MDNSLQTILLNANKFAQISSAAYSDEEQFSTEVLKYNYSEVKFFEADDTQVYVLSNENEVVTVFRGTEKKLKDILTDLNFVKTDFDIGSVHSGFLKAHNLIWKELEIYYRSKLKSQKHYVIGHSLGGALATINAARLLKSNITITSVYTFGQPRIGDLTFAEWFKSNLDESMFRFVNNEDFVTTVPKIGFYHVGQQYYFDSFGKLHVGIPIWKKIIDWIFSKIIRKYDLAGDFPNDFADHGIAEYIKLIEKSLSIDPRDG